MRTSLIPQRTGCSVALLKKGIRLNCPHQVRPYEGIPRRSLEKLVFEFLLAVFPLKQTWLAETSTESSFPQFLPGFALDCFHMDATDPRSGSGFWRRKTCCLDFVKVKESAASPVQLLHWRCSRFRGRFLHIEFILSAELPWHTSALERHGRGSCCCRGQS